MNERNPKDTVAFGLLTIIGIFVGGSMLTMIILAFAGAGTGEGGERVWAGLFSLITACLGALGGYLGGVAVSQRNGKEGQGESPLE